MTPPETSIVHTPHDVKPIAWGPVFAGALLAASLAFVLHSFAAAIGLASSSTSPTWRDASIALWILSGVYLILVALASYGIGGYVAGTLRQPSTSTPIEEVETRDGVHGLLVWGLATLITGLLVLTAAGSLTRLAGPATGPSGAASSVAGENIIAFDLDRLFRSDRRPEAADLTYARAEAARILLSSSSHNGVLPDDRTYLIRLVTARTGLQSPDAERRTDAAIASARETISRGRKSTVILAFMAGSAALLGAAAAWFAATAGGRHRDHPDARIMMWSFTASGSNNRRT